MTEPHPLRKKFIERLEDDFDFLLTETDQNDIALIAEDIYCAPHSSAKESSDVLDKAKAKLDRYYKSLPAHHPYLDGIDLSIQKIEELQEELRTKER